MKIAYVRLLASRMGLGRWDIRLGKNLPKIGDALAHIDIAERQERASIHFNPILKHYSKEDQRQTVVHELVHCHLERIRLASFNWIGPLGAKATQLALDEIHDHVEFAVDAIATAWAPCLPLPED